MSNKITQECPAYIKIRADEKAGVIRASFALMGSNAEREISTLSMQIADEDKQAFDAWKDAVVQIHKKWIERLTGATVIKVTTIPKYETN